MLRDLWFASLCLMLSLMFAGQAFTSKSLAIPDDASDSPIVLNGKSGTALLDNLARNVSSLGTYRYDGTQEAQTGKKVLKASGTFIISATNGMRVDIKQFGSKSGSTLVKYPNGKIVGKGGAQMMGIKLSLAPDSRLLKMPNGLSAFDSDLSSLYARLKKEAASGHTLLSAEQPILVEGLGKPEIVIESQLASDAGAKVSTRVFIDPSLKVPVQWDQFENGRFQARSKFQNYQMNLQLSDSQFSL
jgi:outer membrane lipoprotein-sorting protein